jgi:hypothetical protein
MSVKEFVYLIQNHADLRFSPNINSFILNCSEKYECSRQDVPSPSDIQTGFSEAGFGGKNFAWENPLLLCGILASSG